jgi:hypothetical protein
MRRERGDEDNAAAAAKDRKQSLDKEERRADIDCEEMVEILDCCVFDHSRLGDSGVGHENIQPIADETA